MLRWRSGQRSEAMISLKDREWSGEAASPQDGLPSIRRAAQPLGPQAIYLL